MKRKGKETYKHLSEETLEIEIFNNNQREFGYRESVFKNTCKEKYIIISVTFRLNKRPIYNTSYGAIEQEFIHILNFHRFILLKEIRI